MSEISKRKLRNKLSRYALQAGSKVVYIVLLMYYSYKRSETPKWAKASILGSIAYFLSPIDFIPDLTPILGFTDDLGVLLVGLTAVSMYINKEVRDKAKHKLTQWFDEEDIEQAVEDIDHKIKGKK
ncbi:MAG TPA: YkvA family protein [Saprospiraceae bacterium]|nr:YkvA family protein [Saprospiraceae bacterium]HQW56063.1 YkvA family protein [Saprospiraceae bacterium]